MPRKCATGPHQGWQPDPYSPRIKKYINDGLDDPRLQMKIDQEIANRTAQFKAGVITDSERRNAINKEWDRLSALEPKKQIFHAQGNPKTGELEYRESDTASVLEDLSRQPGELGQMARYLKNQGIEHNLKTKKYKGGAQRDLNRPVEWLTRKDGTRWIPVGITISARDTINPDDSGRVSFDNLYDLLIALGEDPKGPVAQYNHKLSDEQMIRMERAWVKKYGEDWQGQEMDVEYFNWTV